MQIEIVVMKGRKRPQVVASTNTVFKVFQILFG